MNTTPPTRLINMPLPTPGSMGPPLEYARLRRECPLARVRMPMDASAWYVTRHADVRALLADPRLTRPTINDWPPRPHHAASDGPGLVTMMELDGPQHTALRRALAKPFSRRAIKARIPSLRQIANQLLDAFTAENSPADLVSAYLEPFPLMVMCELVGIPYQDRDHFLPLADAALGALITLDEGRRATQSLREYISCLIRRKQRTPTNDILTTLIHARDTGALNDETLISFGLSMLVAGYRTTTMFLANTVLTLLQKPGQYGRLRDDRSLLPSAVEEFLRYMPVMNGVVVLQANEDLSLHGQTIRKGEAVLPVIAAANRDNHTFANPDQLDLRRIDNPHLAFGRGTHNCIGSHLARAQLTVALKALLDRFPHLRIAEGHQPTWDDTSPSKSPLTLPVVW
ncbi:cytochrome P450 [Streptomyces sp. NPDC093097]|uniref:cytochrome P450 n=1 Tax=Streptomyces sp. NPDC093097 TaxID=3366027 RepID=UPI003824D563